MIYAQGVRVRVRSRSVVNDQHYGLTKCVTQYPPALFARWSAYLEQNGHVCESPPQFPPIQWDLVQLSNSITQKKKKTTSISNPFINVPLYLLGLVCITKLIFHVSQSFNTMRFGTVPRADSLTRDADLDRHLPGFANPVAVRPFVF